MTEEGGRGHPGSMICNEEGGFQTMMNVTSDQTPANGESG